ncbi:MAG: NYN domain-containing protein [bacterium]
MQNRMEKYDQIKESLDCHDLKVIIASALSHRNLAKMVNRLRLNSKDIKTTQLATEELAGLLAQGTLSDPAIFREVVGMLDLYSAEAIKAVASGNAEEFRRSTLKEKDQRGKVNTARLIWALVTDNSPQNMTEGRNLITVLDQRHTHEAVIKTDTDDGESIEDRNTKSNQRRPPKASFSRGKHTKGVNHHYELEITRLKGEVECLKKKNAKLQQQHQHTKEPSKAKDLGKKIRLMEKENRDLKEKIKRDYVPKDEFNALKKETDRLYHLCRTTERTYKKGAETQIAQSAVYYPFLKGFKSGLQRLNPFVRVRRTGKNCRVGIFVDVQNMFYSAKNLYHGRLDFEKFLNLALHGRKLVRATAYIVKTPEIDQSKFINLLKNNEYVVKTLDLKTGMNGYAKGNWDVGIVMDIFALADKVDVIALASGDGDFVPLVKYLQKKGIRVEVYAFTYNTAIDLKDCADMFYPLQEDILIKDQRGMVKQH